MVDELVKRALEDIKEPLLWYLTGLGYLVQAPTPEFRVTYERTARRRLGRLREKLQLARQRYEVELGDPQVIKYGIGLLNDIHLVYAPFAQRTGDPTNIQFVVHLQRTLEAILGDTSSSPTLAGLLGLASNYQHGFGSTQVM